MDIVCPRCKTEYELDDAKVTDAGVTVKCANCEYTFKVRARRVVETEPLGDEAVVVQNDAGGGNGKKPWMIRTVDGQLLRFRELPTLQQWIVERKVTREDQISRSGDTWKRLGDIAELASFFQVVDAAMSRMEMDPSGRDTVGPTRMGSSGAVAAPAGPASMGATEQTSSEEPAFASGTGGHRFHTVGPQAAWEAGGRRTTTDFDEDEIPRRRTGRLLVLVLLALVVLGSGVFAAVKPRVVKRLLGGLFARQDVSEAYRNGRELLLKDDEKSLREADQQLAQAPKNSQLARYARVEVATVWAQHLRDHAELLERHVQLLEAQAAAAAVVPVATDAKAGSAKKGSKKQQQKKKTDSSANDPGAARKGDLSARAEVLRLRAGELRESAKRKVDEAAAHAEAGGEPTDDQAEVYRAIADLRRMQGKTGADVLEPLDKALQSKPGDPETYHVQGVYWAAVGNQSKAIDLLKEALVKTRAYSQRLLIRSAFQLAMIHLRAGRREDARRQAESVTSANPDHPWAKELIAQIEREASGAPTTVAPTSPDGGPAAAIAPDASVAIAPDARAAGRPATSPRTPDAPTPGTATPGGARPPAKGIAAPGKGGSYEAMIRSADRLAEHGRTMRALKLYETALKKKSNGVEALTGIAYCQLDLQRYALAIRRFRQAMNVSPTYGDALVGSAEAYKAMGDKRKALDYYKAYLRAHPAGSKALMARRNVGELQPQVGTPTPPAPAAAPDPQPDPAPAPDTPPPLEGEE